MTNQEAIKALEDMRQELICISQTPAYLNEEERQHIICLQIEVYKKAIDALKQTQWIPMSERPPEKNGNYLVTALYKGKPDVDMDYWQLGCMWDDWEDEVIAWMPLPPYEGEEQ